MPQLNQIKMQIPLPIKGSTLTKLCIAASLLLLFSSTNAQTRPDLREAEYFGVLAEQEVQSQDQVMVKRAAGSTEIVSPDIIAEGGIYQDTSCITLKAIQAIKDARTQLKQEQGTVINANQTNQTYTSGTYETTQNMTVSGEMRLQGTEQDVFIFKVGRDFNLMPTGRIVLEQQVKPENVFFDVEGATRLQNGSEMNGTILSGGDVTAEGTTTGEYQIYSESGIEFGAANTVGFNEPAPALSDITLGKAYKYALLAKNNITSPDTTYAYGRAAAVTGILDATVIPSETLTGRQARCDEQQALMDLKAAMRFIRSLNKTDVTGSTGDQNIAPGAYEINSSVTLNDTYTLTGDSTSIYIFYINGSLEIGTDFKIELGEVNPANIYWLAEQEITIQKEKTIAGILMSPGSVVLSGGYHPLAAALSSENNVQLLSGSDLETNIITSQELIPTIYKVSKTGATAVVTGFNVISAEACGETVLSFNFLVEDRYFGGATFDIALPEGMTYVDSSLKLIFPFLTVPFTSIGSESSTSDNLFFSLEPEKKLPGIERIYVVTVRYSLSSDCPATVSDSLRYSVNGTYVRLGENQPFSATSPSFAVSAPKLSIIQSQIIEEDYISDKGASLVRAVPVKNAGNADLHTGFTIVDNNGYAVRIDSVKLTAAGADTVTLQRDTITTTDGIRHDTIFITPADIISAGIDADGTLKADSTVTILEYITVLECTVDSTGKDIDDAGKSRLDYYWECEGEVCDVNFVTVYVHTRLQPDIIITPYSEDSICNFAAETPYWQGLIIENKGGVTAVQSVLQLLQYAPLTYIVPGTFEITDLSGNILVDNIEPFKSVKTGEQQICSPYDSTYTKLNFYLSDLPADSQFIFRWQAKTCCPKEPSPGAYVKNDWRADLWYYSNCPVDTFHIYHKHPTSSYHRDIATIETMPEWPPVMLGNDIPAGWVGDTSQFRTYLNLPRFWQGDSTAQLKVVYTIGTPLVYVADSSVRIVKGGTEWMPEQVDIYPGSGSSDPDTVVAWFAFPPLPTFDTIKDVGDWNDYYAPLFKDAKLIIVLTPDCPTDPPTMVKQEMFYIPSTTQCTGCEVSLSYIERPVVINCPGCMRQGIHFTSYDFRRTNYGLPDNNNDGVAEAGTADPAAIATNRAMTGDTLELTANTYVEISGAYEPWPFEGPDGTPYTLKYGYYELVPLCLDDLTSLGMVMEIYDASTASSHTFTIPAEAVTIRSDLGKNPTDSLTGFYYDYSIDTIHKYNPNSASYDRFDNGDNITFRLLFKVTGNPGAIKPEPCGLEWNQMYLGAASEPECDPASGCAPDSGDISCGSTTQCDSTVRYFCNEYGAAYDVSLVGYDQIHERYVFDDRGCTRRLVVKRDFKMGKTSGRAGGNNYFYNEYRSWGVADTTLVEVPEGYIFERASLTNVRTSITPTSLTDMNRIDSIGYDAVLSGTKDTLVFYLSQHFTYDAGYAGSDSTLLYHSDDDFFTDLLVEFSVACNTPADSFLSNYVSGNFAPFFDPDSAARLAFEDAGELLFRAPQLVATSNIFHKQAVDRSVCWDVQVYNYEQFSVADNPWFQIQTSDRFQVTSVTALNGDTMPLMGDLYRLNPVLFGKPNIKTFRICGTYDCSMDLSPDSITVITGWDCPDFPATLADFACAPDDTTTLSYKPEDAELEIDITADELMDMCGSLPVSVKIQNIGIGTAYDMEVEIRSVQGLVFESDSGKLDYPYGSGFITVNDPAITGQHTYLWQLNSISDSFNVDKGLPGKGALSDESLSALELKFKMLSDCDFRPGSQIEIIARGVTNCGDTIEERRIVKPDIKNHTIPNNRTVAITATDMTACQTTSTVSVSIENKSISTTEAGERFYFALPPCMSYDGNLNWQSNPPANTTPQFSTNNDTLIIEIAGIAGGQTSTFSFAIEVNDPYCAEHPYFGMVTIPDTIACSTGGDCFTESVIDQTEGIIEQVTPMSVSVQTTPTCFGDCTGTAFVNITGGRADHEIRWYKWYGTSTLGLYREMEEHYNFTTADSLCFIKKLGAYYVEVTDADGCSEKVYFNIGQHPQLNVQLSKQDPFCSGDTDGKAWVTASGGVQPYSYEWTSRGTPIGIGTDTIGNLTPGTYTVTVTDSAGCSVTDSITINTLSNVNAAFTYSPLEPTILTTVNFNSNNSTPQTGATYEWYFGDGNTSTLKNPSHLYSTAGTYTVTLIVTDSIYGCTDTATQTIVVDYAIAVSVGNVTQELCDRCDASATVTVTSGIPPYTYQWSNGETTATATGLCSGNHTVIVADSLGGRDTLTVNIGEQLVDSIISASVGTYYPADGEVWEDMTMRIDAPIVVDEGVDFTIRNCTLMFAPVLSTGESLSPFAVRVEPVQSDGNSAQDGGSLYIDSSYLTSCAAKWQGMEVWGTGNQPRNNTNVHDQEYGVIEITNSTVENALAAIYAGRLFCFACELTEARKDAGVVIARDSRFSNNHFAVSSGQFFSQAGGAKQYHDFNRIKFSAFEIDSLNPFETDSTYPFSDASLRGMIAPTAIVMGKNSSAVIQGNDFEDKRTTVHDTLKAIGISSYQSRFDVLGKVEICDNTGECNWVATPNRFINLSYGIVTAGNAGARALPDINIDENEFIDNWRGIVLNGTHDVTITRNTFDVPEITGLPAGYEPYGVYLNGSTGFLVEGNILNSGSGTDARGIVAHNTGTAGNEVYRNTFDGLPAATQAQEDNSGLEYKCNDYNNSVTADIAVTSGSVAPEQGDCPPTLPETTDPAGNLFSRNGGNDIVINGTTGFLYNFHQNISDYPRLLPQNPSNLVNIPDPCLVQYNDSLSCPTTVTDDIYDRGWACFTCMPVIGGTGEDINTNIALIDGNRTPDLIAILHNIPAEPPIKKQQELMQPGPYLSDEVLIEAVRDQQFPSANLTDVLVYNSPLSPEVMAEVDLRQPQLTTTDRQRLNDAQVGTSERTLVEQQIKRLNIKRQQAINGMIRTYATDRSLSGAEKSDSIIALLESIASEPRVNPHLSKGYVDEQVQIQARKRLAETYIEQQEITKAEQHLREIPANTEENTLFNELQNIKIDMVQGNRTIREMTEAEKTKVWEIALTNTATAVAAQNLLKIADNARFVELVEPIQMTQTVNNKTGSWQQPEEQEDATISKENSYIKVYPNPTRDEVIVEGVEQGVKIIVYDLLGKEIINRIAETNKTIIDLSGLRAGVYIYKIGQNEMRGKITVVK